VELKGNNAVQREDELTNYSSGNLWCGWMLRPIATLLGTILALWNTG